MIRLEISPIISISVMSRMTKGIFVACSLLAAAMLGLLCHYYDPFAYAYLTVGKPTFDKARAAADPLMRDADDGPWVYSHGSFILDPLEKPVWVFRYKHAQTGEESRRIYVSIPELEVYEKTSVFGLDPLPFRGELPK